MMKDYIIGGKQYQYEEGTQPKDAVEAMKKVEPQNKAVKSQNKKRKAATK